MMQHVQKCPMLFELEGSIDTQHYGQVRFELHSCSLLSQFAVWGVRGRVSPIRVEHCSAVGFWGFLVPQYMIRAQSVPQLLWLFALLRLTWIRKSGSMLNENETASKLLSTRQPIRKLPCMGCYTCAQLCLHINTSCVACIFTVKMVLRVVMFSLDDATFMNYAISDWIEANEKFTMSDKTRRSSNWQLVQSGVTAIHEMIQLPFDVIQQCRCSHSK